MKFKNLILAGFALVSMAACSSEDDPQDTNQDSQNYNAYVQISLIGGDSTQSRTEAGGDGTNDGTSPDETQISNVLVLLCDQSTDQVKTTQYFKTLSAGKGGTFNTPVFPIQCTTTTTFNVYVIANYNSNVFGSDVNGASDIKKVVTKELVAEANIKDHIALKNSFMMFNQSVNSNYTPIQITVNPTVHNDINNPATLGSGKSIALDRLATKITTTANAPTITTLQAQCDLIESVKYNGFKLLNGAKTMNLQQKWAFATNAGTPKQNTLLTPTTQQYYNPFFGKSAGFGLIVRTSGLNEYPEKYTTVKDNTTAETFDTKPVYCLENNPSVTTGPIGADAKYDNATGLLFQYQATLTNAAKLAQSTVSESFGTNTFFSYGGKFYATLAALEIEHPTVFNSVDKDGGPAKYDLESAKAKLAEAFTSPSTPDQNKLSEFRCLFNIKVYANGIMYYTHFIKDKNYYQLLTGQTENSYNSSPSLSKIGLVYSVFRNTIYDLTVTNLLKVGTDIPGFWNPYVNSDSVIDTKNVYMTVAVKVNPWVKHIENIELGK